MRIRVEEGSESEDRVVRVVEDGEEAGDEALMRTKAVASFGREGGV